MNYAALDGSSGHLSMQQDFFFAVIPMTTDTSTT